MKILRAVPSCRSSYWWFSFLLFVSPAWAAELTGPVQTARTPDGIAVRFTVSELTDVAVSIVDANEKVLRHLGAGNLGANPPLPFRPGAQQVLTWDLLDDDGNQVDPAGTRVKISLGLTGQFERVLGWSGQSFEMVRGLACGPDGTLYTVFGEQLYAHRQTTLVTAFDPKGQYLRQVFPGSAKLELERRAGWPFLKRDDGEEVPVIQHLLSRSVVPGAVFGNRAIPAVTSDGKTLVFVSGADEGTTVKHTDQRGGRRLLILGTDGSVPQNFLGPMISEEMLGGFGRIALSPDDRVAYVAGLFEGGKDGSGLCEVIWRVTLDGSSPAEVFAGSLYDSGGGPKGLSDPQGLATDAAGNVYVCDYGNDRIAIFDSEGGYLAELPIEQPDTVQVSRRTGAIYVMTLKEREKAFNGQHSYVAAHNWRPDRIVKFDSVKATEPSATLGDLLQTKMGGGAYFALDDSDDSPVLWISGRRYQGGDIYKAVDRGGKLEIESTPISDAIPKEETPLPFIGNVAVFGDEVIVRHPTFRPVLKPESLRYNGATGETLDPFVPKSPEGRAENYWQLVYGEMISGRDNRAYVHAKVSLRRYGANGDPAPFAAADNYILGNLGFDRHTTNASMFATCDGTLYLATVKKNNAQALDEDAIDIRVIDADGNTVNESLITVEGARLGGLAVDSRGNVYLGAQVVSRYQPIPDWVKNGRPGRFESDSQLAAYAQMGAVVKFSQEGGAIRLAEKGDYVAQRQKSNLVSIEGGELIARGGLIPGKTSELGPGCNCETTRFDIDAQDRLFVPDPHRFAVRVLDTAGNELTRFGRFGNMDDRGPEITFGWPLTVRVSNGRAYIADLVNRRVVVVRLGYTQESIADLK